MDYETIRFEKEGVFARVTLNRPEIRNAFNDRMLEELLDAFDSIMGDSVIRVVILTGEGKAFCAGADLHWMKRVVDYSCNPALERRPWAEKLPEGLRDAPRGA